MNKKVFVFDIDGTLLQTSKNSIRKDSIESIKRLKKLGHILIIATGRSLNSTLPLLFSSKLEDYFDFIILNNGGYIFTPHTKETHVFGEVSKATVYSLLNHSHQISSVFCINTSNGDNKCLRNFDIDDIPTGLDNYFKDTYTDLNSLSRLIDTYPLTQVTLVSENIPELMRVKSTQSQISKECFTIAAGNSLDVNPPGVSKGSSLMFISKTTNIPLLDFIAFGDSGNDISMFEVVGTSIIMANASPKYKTFADIEIGNNDSDAISKYLQDHF